MQKITPIKVSAKHCILHSLVMSTGWHSVLLSSALWWKYLFKEKKTALSSFLLLRFSNTPFILSFQNTEYFWFGMKFTAGRWQSCAFSATADTVICFEWLNSMWIQNCNIHHGSQLCGQTLEMLIGFHGKAHNYSVNFSGDKCLIQW